MIKRLLIYCFFFCSLPQYFVAQYTQSKTHAVYFASEKFTPTKEQKAALQTFIKSLDTLKIQSIRIAGYCDDAGDNPFNDSLSVWRAKTVRQLIVQSGYKAAIVKEVKGGGEIQPHGSDRSKNRRVDIVVNYQVSKKSVQPEKKKPEIVSPQKHAYLLEQKPDNLLNIFTDSSKIGDIIVLQFILFESGYHYILPESNKHLQHLMQELKDNPQFHIRILGHVCCEKPGNDSMDFGTGKGNLSVARAKVIYDFLVSNGIDKNRLDYKGMKSDYKLGIGEKYDKRVEIEITKIDQ